MRSFPWTQGQIDELVRIAKWYERADLDRRPAEHETVAYLVVPLLRALGWTPQRMGIEWNKVDVALFGRLPRSSENLLAVVEAKRRGDSCLSARSQAEDYITKTGASACRRLVVTDGSRYGVYVRDGDRGFSAQPTAYLNLARMMHAYPIFGCKGAAEALLRMSADWA